MLEVKEICREFPDFTLGPISQGFRPGITYGLLGPNGAGKTTLLNCLTLQLRLSSGSLRYAGEPIAWGDSRWKEHFSYIRESPAFYDELSVGQTLHLASHLYSKWDAAFSVELSNRLGLRMSDRVRFLSKGTRVKLGLVTALAHHADLILLDEPTAGLDPSARSELQDLLCELHQSPRKVCMLISSHLFEDIRRVAEEVLILRNGKIVFTAVLKDLDQYRLLRIPAGSPLPEATRSHRTWHRNGSIWMLLPSESVPAYALSSIPGAEVFPALDSLEEIYHGTESYANAPAIFPAQ
jgi:ABC-2 type transport system ATP-binding protein